MTRVEVRICGLGGQGVVLAGHLLGHAAVYDGKRAVQTQSYGAEARGSAAKSEVIISDDEIGFPIIRNCDILVAMSQTALDMYVVDLKEHAFLLIDRDLVQKSPKVTAQIHKLPATYIAETRLKSKMYANVVMLGALTSITKIVSQASMKRAIEATVKADVEKKNLQAFELGFSL